MARQISMDRSFGLIGVFAIVFVAYIGFSGTISVGEVGFATLVAAVSTACIVVIVRLADMEQTVETGWARRLAGPCVDVLTEVWPLSKEVVVAVASRRRIDSQVETRHFDPGSSETPQDRGRRALVTLAISLAPARIVADKDVDTRRLHVRQVAVPKKAGAFADPHWPI